MKTTAQGREAEVLVAEHLGARGYDIVDRNWRTKLCEIDIIAIKDSVVYFVEVKHRAGAAQGDGLDYITTRKRRQLVLAARLWCLDNNWDGDYRLLAASTLDNGGKIVVDQVVELD